MCFLFRKTSLLLAWVDITLISHIADFFLAYTLADGKEQID